MNDTSSAWHRIKLHEAIDLLSDILPDYKAEIRRTAARRNREPNWLDLPILARADAFLKEVKASEEVLPVKPDELSFVAHELADRWERIRQLIGSKSDDTVQEVFDRCEQYHAFWTSHGGPGA